QSRKEITNDSLHRKHISEKETGRWIEGYKKATELASSCPDTQIISVSDREGDIYTSLNVQKMKVSEPPRVSWRVFYL
ncbi:TPA: hypothetical protein ACXYRS_002888, partial [Escherichia coli]